MRKARTLEEYKILYRHRSGQLGAARKEINKLREQIKVINHAMSLGDRSYKRVYGLRLD